MTATRELTRFTPEDDLLHDEISRSGPHARESLLLTAPIPEEQLLVFLYLWREGGDRWGRFVFVGGPEMDTPLFVSHLDDASFSGRDLRDFTVGGLHWRQPEPLRVAEVEFAERSASGTSIGAERSASGTSIGAERSASGTSIRTAPGLELSVRFEGIHEPFSWHDNAAGCPDWVAHNRYEQSGLTRGVLTLGERRVEFAGAGHRDHSWGSRNWNMLQHWKWMNAATPDGSASLHVMIMSVKGETVVNGYLNRDGLVSPIASARASATLDERMYHRALTGRFTDEAGREMTLECEYAAGWTMPIRHLLLNEIGMTATLDGRPAVAHVELGWPADYVRGLTEPSA